MFDALLYRSRNEEVVSDAEALTIVQKQLLDWWAQWPSVVADHLDRLGREGRPAHLPANTGGDCVVRST
jgi:hypothetical protein